MELSKRGNKQDTDSKSVGMLTREALLKKQELKIEKVDLDDEQFVFVREMTGYERDQFEHSMYKVTGVGKDVKTQTSTENFRSKLAVCTICDEEGNLLLKMEDYLPLSKAIGAKRLERIIEVAQKLNKITEEDKEELAKNFEAAQAGGSNSDSAES